MSSRHEFTPENLMQMAEDVELLRIDLLININEAGADPMAQRYFLMALNALEQAKHYFAMAQLTQTKALAK